MPTFSNLQDAIKYAKQQTQDALNKEVANKIKEVEHEHVKTDVYDVYTPKKYARQRDNYGLSDVRNMNTKQYSEVGIEISNDTVHPDEFFNDVYVADVVESGHGYEYDFEYNGVKRPFQENTVEELERTKEHVKALKEGLKKRGIDTK